MSAREAAPGSTLAVVEGWQDAVNARDAQRAQALCAEEVELTGPRGAARGRDVLAQWLERSGFSADATRWFCGGDGERAVVEQAAAWTAPDGTRTQAVVASSYRVRDGRITAYARHDTLAAALSAAGLDPRDEVRR